MRNIVMSPEKLTIESGRDFWEAYQKALDLNEGVNIVTIEADADGNLMSFFDGFFEKLRTVMASYDIRNRFVFTDPDSHYFFNKWLEKA